MKAVIHIGPTKTGSTALSRYFHLANTRKKLPSNIIYPEGDLWFGQQKHSMLKFWQTVTDHEAENFGDFIPEVDQAFKNIVEHARVAGGEDATVVFISETLMTMPNPSTLTRPLSKYFSDITFVMVARLQDEAIASGLTQMLKAKIDNQVTSLDVAEFMANKSAVSRFDYALQLDRWLPIADEHKLVVLPYLSSSTNPHLVVTTFSAGLGHDVKLPRIPKFEQSRPNRSPTAQQLLEFVSLKRQYSRALVENNVTVMANLTAQFKTLQNASQSTEIHASAEGNAAEKPWRLPPRDAFIILSAFDGSNRRLLTYVEDSPLAGQWGRWQKNLEKRLAEGRALTKNSRYDADA